MSLQPLSTYCSHRIGVFQSLLWSWLVVCLMFVFFSTLGTAYRSSSRLFSAAKVESARTFAVGNLVCVFGFCSSVTSVEQCKRTRRPSLELALLWRGSIAYSRSSNWRNEPVGPRFGRYRSGVRVRSGDGGSTPLFSQAWHTSRANGREFPWEVRVQERIPGEVLFHLGSGKCACGSCVALAGVGTHEIATRRADCDVGFWGNWRLACNGLQTVLLADGGHNQ